MALVPLVTVLLFAGSCLGSAPPTTSPAASAASTATRTVVVDGITAIYNLGDSLSDTGNLARQGATGGLLRYTTRLPYGVTVGRATGRCSDGYLIIDFLARDLGLPLLNPYLDEGADFAHGVNFAVAGATALNTTALAARGITVPHTNSPLDLRWFKEFMNSTTSSPQEIREKLSKSLVMLGEIGGNDYNYAFLQTWPMDGGARHGRDAGGELVIPGNLPLGCVPSYMSALNATDRAAYDARGCLVALNLFAALHNAWLRRAVGELRRAYRGAAVVAYADYSAAYAATLDGAAALGFDERRAGDGGVRGPGEVNTCGVTELAIVSILSSTRHTMPPDQKVALFQAALAN
uniref:Esterase n=1 Tax=Oryza barthii TaxID=65489 RepID=A0A0D3F7B8_9ORYZ